MAKKNIYHNNAVKRISKSHI